MRNAIHILLLILLCSSSAFAQNKDSIKIAEAFTKALTSPEQKDDFLKDALNVKNKRKTEYVDEVYAYWNARYLFFTGQLDEAEEVVTEHLESAPEVQEEAKFHNIMGTISTMRQDYKKAISWYEKAIEAYEGKKDKKGAALVKSNIANIFFSLSDFESAYKYIKESHDGLKPYNDSVNFVNVLGILSISEAKTGRYASALKHAEETLDRAKIIQGFNGMSLAYLALGEIALTENREKDAVMYFAQTDSAAILVNNVNFSHLAHVGMLGAYIELEDYANAKKTGEQALDELQVVPNKTTEFAIRKNLAKVYAALNEYQKAYEFKRIADSIYTVTSSRQNKEYINELLIRHDTERKEGELKIERKENQIKEAKLTQQGWILFALALILLIAILVFISYRKAQRNKMNQLQTEQENKLMRALVEGEEKERERIANELHDGLASDLTGIKMILSQSEEKLPSGVLNALSRVHEETRRISHNLSPLNLEKLGLVSALNNFAQENSTAAVKIHFYASKDHIDIEPIEHAVLIYRISQELIQNALKHADCSEIDVQLMVQEDGLSINIEDNGKGFDAEAQKTSFGLMNVRKQVELLNGEISIDSQPEKGTVVFISLPLR